MILSKRSKCVQGDGVARRSLLETQLRAFERSADTVKDLHHLMGVACRCHPWTMAQFRTFRVLITESSDPLDDWMITHPLAASIEEW